MSNLRSAIEKAEAEKNRKAEEARLREKQLEIEKQKQAEIDRQNQRIRIQQANKHFSAVIMPIFTEIAAAKRINLSSDPYKKPGLAGLFSGGQGLPQQPGFSKYEGTLDRIAVYGTLIWNIKEENIGLSNYEKEWDYLSMGITSDGILIAEFYPMVNVFSENHLKTLWAKVEEIMVQGKHQRGYYRFEYQSP